MYIAEVDISDNPAQPSKRFIEQHLGGKEDPSVSISKGAKQVLIRLDTVDQETLAVYLQGETASYFFFISFMQLDQPPEYYRLDNFSETIEEFSFVNVNPMTFAAFTQEAEIAIFVFKGSFQLLQLIPLDSYSITYTPSSDFIYMQPNVYESVAGKVSCY